MSALVPAATPQSRRKLLACLLPTVIVAFAAVIWTHAVVGAAMFSGADSASLAVAFFVARMLQLQLPQGDRVRITLVAGVVGITLMGIPEVLVAATLAGALDVLLRFGRVSRAEMEEQLVDSARAALVIALASPWQVLLNASAMPPLSSDSALAVVLFIGASYAFLDILTLAAQEWLSGGAGLSKGIVMLMRPLTSVYMVHIAMAAVVVRIYPSLGLWGFAIVLLLTFILQNSFSLYLRIRRAYAQTIGALAHAAELDRPDDTGHAQRVADLAVSVGRQMGLSSIDLERIGYAALLHDIGRIGDERLEVDGTHPLRGAAIAAKVPFLEGVAPLIAHHREEDEADTPRGAAVVGVCCRFDRLSASYDVDVALELLESDEHGFRADVTGALRRTLRDRPSRLGAAENSS